MATRRPRIKVRPNLQRARAGNSVPADDGKLLDPNPKDDGSSLISKTPVSPSQNDTASSITIKSPLSSVENSVRESSSEGKIEVTGVSEKTTKTGSAPQCSSIVTHRPSVKVQHSLSAKSSDNGLDKNQSSDLSPAMEPEAVQNIPDSDVSAVAETNCCVPELSAAGKRRPRLKIRPNLNRGTHKASAVSITDGDEADAKENTMDSAQNENSMADQTVEASVSEPAVTEEVLKSPTRRARFIRAKPNIAEAERRHQRLSSFSETDDPGMLWKFSGNSDKGTIAKPAAEPKLNDNQVKSEIQTNVDVSDKKKQSKGRRRQSVKLDKLVSENRRSFTISDLIHMNPVSNPMQRYLNKENKMKAKVQEERPISPSSVSSKLNSPSTHDSALASPRVPDVIIDDDDDDDDDNVDVQDGDETGDNAMPVPQVMLGPDGNIVLNDASLTIKNVDAEPNPTIIESDVVIENDNYDPSFYYKSRKRSITWSIKETTKFYVALSCLGTDFSLMAKLFPKRDRGELKRKFKLEEKKHRALVDKALGERLSLDMSLFDISDEDSDEETQGSGNENFADTVKGVLETERDAGKAKRKNDAKVRKNRKTEEKNENTAPPTLPIRKAKKKKSGWKSRYYDCSDDESDADADEKAQSDSGKQDGSGTDGEVNSDAETSLVQRIVETPTRSGRQPKRTVPFTIPEEKVHKKRRPPSFASSKSVSSISQTWINPQLAPVVRTPPVGMSHRMLEDTETGQRLLLVKSPPPFDRDGSSEFVHIYLMSPRRNRNDSSSTSAISHPNDETDVFIPPPVSASRQTSNIQEEIITDELRLIDCNNVYREDAQNSSQEVDWCNERTLNLTSPHPVQFSDFRNNINDTFSLNPSGSEHTRSATDIYENAEITTLTNEEGKIIEILIDPGLSNDGNQSEPTNS